MMNKTHILWGLGALALLLVLFLLNGKYMARPEENEATAPSAREALLGKIPETEEERKSHFDRAILEAKIATALEIGKCEFNPLVLRIFEGESVTFTNTSADTRTVFLPEGQEATLEPNETRTENVVFGQGPGLYGVGCDLVRDNASGFILVTPKELAQ